MNLHKERMHILELIDRGIITAQDGIHLLESFDEIQVATDTDSFAESDPQQSPAELVSAPVQTTEDVAAKNEAVSVSLPRKRQPRQPATSAQSIIKPKLWWILPFFIGISTALVSAAFIWERQASGWVIHRSFAASLFLILGLLLAIFAWYNRYAPWLQLQVLRKGKPPLVVLRFPLLFKSAMSLRRYLTRKQFISDTRSAQTPAVSPGHNLDSHPAITIDLVGSHSGNLVQLLIG